MRSDRQTYATKRDALFEEGRDLGNRSTLAELASEWGLGVPDPSPSRRVVDDFAEGRRRGLTGSPDFRLGGEEFFCPTLDIGHGAGGELTANFNGSGLARFISRAHALELTQGDHR